MFKKLFLTTFFTMCLCMLVSNDVFASQTDEDIAAKIADKYEVGEALNQEDEKIILELMMKNNVIQPKKFNSDSFETNALSPKGTKYFNSNNRGVYLSGVCEYNFWKSPISNYYNCQVGSFKKGGSNNKVSIRHIGYGLSVNKTVIKSYDRTFSYSAKKEYITVSHSESYSGLTGWGVFIGTATVDGTSVTQTLQ